MKLSIKNIISTIAVSAIVSNTFAADYKTEQQCLAPRSLLTSSFMPFRGKVYKFLGNLLNTANGQENSKLHRKFINKAFANGEVALIHRPDEAAMHNQINGVTVLAENSDGTFRTQKVHAEGKRMVTKGKTNRNKVLEEAIDNVFNKNNSFLMRINPKLLTNYKQDHSKVKVFTAPAGMEEYHERTYEIFRDRVFKEINKESGNAYKILNEFHQLRKLANLTIDNEDYENILKTAFEESQETELSRQQLVEASYLIKTFIVRVKTEPEFVATAKEQRKNWKNRRLQILKDVKNALEGSNSNRTPDVELSTLMENIMAKSRTNEKLRNQLVAKAKESRKETIKKLLQEKEKELYEIFKIHNKKNNLTYSEEWKEIALKVKFKDLLLNETRKHFREKFIFNNDAYLDDQKKRSSSKEAPQGLIPVNFDCYTHDGRTDLQSEEKHFKQIRSQIPVLGRIREINKRSEIIRLLEEEKSSNQTLKFKGENLQKRIDAIDTKIAYQLGEIKRGISKLNETVSARLKQGQQFKLNCPDLTELYFAEKGDFKIDLFVQEITEHFDLNAQNWKVKDDKGNEFSIAKDQGEIVSVPNMKKLRSAKKVENLDPNNPEDWVEVLAIHGKPITGDWDVFETGVICKNNVKKMMKVAKDKSRIIKNGSMGYGQKSDKRQYLAINAAFNMFGLPSPIQHHASKHSVLAEGGEEIEAAFPLLAVFKDTDGNFETLEINSRKDYNNFLKNYGVVITQNPLLPAEPVKTAVNKIKAKAKAFKLKNRSS